MEVDDEEVVGTGGGMLVDEVGERTEEGEVT